MEAFSVKPLKLSDKTVTIDCYEMKLCECKGCGSFQAVKFSTLYGKVPAHVSWYCRGCGTLNHDGPDS